MLTEWLRDKMLFGRFQRDTAHVWTKDELFSAAYDVYVNVVSYLTGGTDMLTIDADDRIAGMLTDMRNALSRRCPGGLCVRSAESFEGLEIYDVLPDSTVVVDMAEFRMHLQDSRGSADNSGYCSSVRLIGLEPSSA